jgi:uncharacterized repeat protein (TIGR03803 family)
MKMPTLLIGQFVLLAACWLALRADGQGRVETVLHSFVTGSHDGNDLACALILGTNGYFYGTTESGAGNTSEGTVFEMTPQGQFTILHSFGDGTVTKFTIKPSARLPGDLIVVPGHGASNCPVNVHTVEASCR